MTVLGAGSFGTALAVHLAQHLPDVRLWGRDAEALRAMEAARENSEYLPGCHFPKALHAEPDLLAALDTDGPLLIAVPSHALAAILTQIAPHLGAQRGLVLACKGLEPETGRLPHEVVHAVLGEAHPLAVLSGPTFARELGLGLPTAVAIASTDEAFAEQVVNAFHYGAFRAYWNDDVVGVEVGGAVKNVIAIATGLTDGLGLGANTRTAVITRGLAEIMRLSEALGGKRDTLMGLAGMGDLVLTCTDDQSRNRRMGKALAAGKSLEAAQKEIRQVVEGVRVAPEVLRLAERLGVDMPITTQIVAILRGDTTPHDALRTLVTRPPRAEQE
ncbi:NAD(P)H-dependent glycerol-3-phosphate dehydrogenase [Algiphilus sp.]|uniref:NAD(P)H-dependent glycerol-3-phosphate dehydrogenase n=1 Tax=Algiphilus sp. TaxID=1872431 RepID=UPI0032EB43F5